MDNFKMIPRYHIFQANYNSGAYASIFLFSHYYKISVLLEPSSDSEEDPALITAIEHLNKCGYNIIGIGNVRQHNGSKEDKFIISDTFENKPLNI